LEVGVNEFEKEASLPETAEDGLEVTEELKLGGL
jgi:hypothetical protein